MKGCVGGFCGEKGFCCSGWQGVLLLVYRAVESKSLYRLLCHSNLLINTRIICPDMLYLRSIILSSVVIMFYSIEGTFIQRIFLTLIRFLASSAYFVTFPYSQSSRLGHYLVQLPNAQL